MTRRRNPLLDGSLGNAGIRKKEEELPRPKQTAQPGLFDPPADVKGMVRKPSSITSIDAARDATKGADKLRDEILLVFRQVAPLGLTDYELHTRYFPDEIYSSVQKRRFDLTTEKFGAIVIDSGDVRTRSPMGDRRHQSKMIVWRLRPYA